MQLAGLGVTVFEPMLAPLWGNASSPVYFIIFPVFDTTTLTVFGEHPDLLLEKAYFEKRRSRKKVVACFAA